MVAISESKFTKAVEQWLAGDLETPSVSVSGKSIDYFGYQLAVHHFNLKIMAKGMSCRGVKLKDLKDYYGLKGRSAQDCLSQFEKIQEWYKAVLEEVRNWTTNDESHDEQIDNN